MSDYDQFKRGGVSYPITASLANPALQDVDPALYYTLSFFESVLNTYLGPRMLAEAARAPAIAAITDAVAGVIPVDPTPYLQEQHFKFPLLAVYRKRESFEDKTLVVGTVKSQWAIDYIMPPLTPGQMERMYPFLHAVGQVLHNRIENVSDPGYEDTLAVWEAAGLDKIELEEAVYGNFAGTGNLVFPAWRALMTVSESDALSGTGSAADGLEDLEGLDDEEQLEDPTGEEDTLEDVVNTQTDF
jgi:hypothetical protein